MLSTASPLGPSNLPLHSTPSCTEALDELSTAVLVYTKTRWFSSVTYTVLVESTQIPRKDYEAVHVETPHCQRTVHQQRINARNHCTYSIAITYTTTVNGAGHIMHAGDGYTAKIMQLFYVCQILPIQIISYIYTFLSALHSVITLISSLMITTTSPLLLLLTPHPMVF